MGEVVEVEQLGDLLLVVLGPEPLRHMPRLKARVEVGRATVRAWVNTAPRVRGRPDGLAERVPHGVA